MRRPDQEITSVVCITEYNKQSSVKTNKQLLVLRFRFGPVWRDNSKTESQNKLNQHLLYFDETSRVIYKVKAFRRGSHPLDHFKKLPLLCQSCQCHL